AKELATAYGRSVAASRDGHIVAAHATDECVGIWDVRTCKFLIWDVKPCKLLKHIRARPSAVDAKTAEILKQLSKGLGGRGGSSGPIALSPDGKLLATTDKNGDDRIIIISETATRKACLTLREKGEGETRVLAFSPDGMKLASDSVGNTALLWDLSQLKNAGARDEGARGKGGIPKY